MPQGQWGSGAEGGAEKNNILESTAVWQGAALVRKVRGISVGIEVVMLVALIIINMKSYNKALPS